MAWETAKSEGHNAAVGHSAVGLFLLELKISKPLKLKHKEIKFFQETQALKCVEQRFDSFMKPHKKTGGSYQDPS